MIKKLRSRYRKWRAWCYYSHYNWLDKLLIFLGIKKNPWFDSFTTYQREESDT